MFILKWVLLALGSAGIVYVSRRPLLDPGSHGFYRAFAWETILIAIVLNVDVWFRDALSWHQIVSWVFLSVSLFLAVHATFSLKRLGKPDKRRDEAHLIGIEKTTVLVTAGTYRFIRHPMYSSLLFLAWGVFFKVPSWTGGLASSGATLFLVATAKVEERENVRYFGAAYTEYMKRSKMFVPFFF